MTVVPGSINAGYLVILWNIEQIINAILQTKLFYSTSGNSEQELDIAAFKLTKTYALITFTKAVNLHNCCVSFDATTKFDTKKWLPISGKHVQYDSIWKLEDSFELNNESNLKLDLTFIDETGTNHMLPITKCNDGLFGIKMPKFGYEFGNSVMIELKGQLTSCQQLLEYEPESKCK